MTIHCGIVGALPNSNVLSLSAVRYLSGRRPDPQTSETVLPAGSNPPCCHFETRACSYGVSTMFPGSYMFPDTYVPRTYVPRYLCSPVPMFLGTDVPRFFVL